MHDSFRVRGFKGVGQLNPEGQDGLEIERTASYTIAERFAVEQFHHDEVFGVVLLNSMNGADVRMIERRRGAGFALKALQQIRVVRQRRRQKLQGDMAA